jgi:hypothetical protein
MSKTSSKGSAGTMLALTAGGAVFVLVSAALAQGVQGPNTFQGGTGGVTPGTLQPGAAAGALNAYSKPGAAGIIAPDSFKAAPPASPLKAVGAEPPPSPGKGTASTKVGPQGAGYLKSPSKGDPKAKIGDIKGAKIIGEEGLVSPRDPALKSKANVKGQIIGEDGLRSCATGKVC